MKILQKFFAALVVISMLTLLPVQTHAQQRNESQATPHIAGAICNLTPVEIDAGQHEGSHAIGGGVVGALLDSQIGGGNGRTAAEIAGAVGGGCVCWSCNRRQLTHIESLSSIGSSAKWRDTNRYLCKRSWLSGWR